jgi:hypothetical protein
MNSRAISARCITAGPVVVVVLFLGLSYRSSASELPRSEIQGTVNELSDRGDRISVTAFLLQTPDGYPVFTTECRTHTDSEGNYRCSSIPPGHYILLASPSPSPSELSAHQGDAPSPTFYPGTTDIENAELVKARPNALNVFNFSVLQRSLYQISGSIERKPSSVALTLYRLDVARAFKLTSREVVDYDPATGNFTINGVSNGQYLLVGNCYLNQAPHESPTLETPKMVSVVITVAGDNISDAVLTPKPLTTIDGQLEVDGAIPGRSFRLELQNTEDGRQKYEITVSPNGTFRLRDLPSGNYRIADLSLAGAYVRFVKVGDLAPSAGQFLIPSDSSLHIEMSLHSKTISGAVSDWNSADSRAHILAKNELTGDVHIAEIDQSGRFLIGDLAPGEYDLYAWKSLEGIAYRTLYGLKQYENNKVTVSADDNLSMGEVEVPLSSPPN